MSKIYLIKFSFLIDLHLLNQKIMLQNLFVLNFVFLQLSLKKVYKLN